MLPLGAAPLRPTTITWGGVDGNDQFIGSRDKWPFVQKYMDGFVMHNVYWEGHHLLVPPGTATPQSVHEVEAALGDILRGSGKQISLESGLGFSENAGFDPAIPAKREAYRLSQNTTRFLHEFDAAGLHVTKNRLDWFPIVAMSRYAAKYQITDLRDLLAMTTGADQFWGQPSRFDASLANWREYVTALHAAFPDLVFGFDQAPCNFAAVTPNPDIRKLVPWPGFGYGYYKPYADAKKQPLLFNGAPVSPQLDFADLLNSVSLATRSWGITFSGFECDTPYAYVERSLGPVGHHLLPFLLAMERAQHKAGFPYGKFINDGIGYNATTDHDKWDRKYHDRSLKFLEVYQAAGGRADQYIFESWYAGPFTFFPETKPGTYTNLVRDAIRRVRGIDDQGRPFNADLAVRARGDTAFAGRGIYQTVPAGAQVILARPGMTYEIQVTNNAVAVNPGDARATPLVRAETSLPVAAQDAEGHDITPALTAQGDDNDGWFVGGLEPGESRSFFVTVPAGTPSGKVVLNLYWNPQDPKALVRDSIALQFQHDRSTRSHAGEVQGSMERMRQASIARA